MNARRLLIATLGVAILLGSGCTDVAGRRLLVLRQAQIVLKHSATEPAWAANREILEYHIEEELRDE